MKLGKVSAVLVAFGLCALSPSTNAEENHTPGTLPVGSNPHGMSYGEWAVAWWQWVLSQPADANPLIDETGEFCDVGQTDSVWFLAGSPGFGEWERWCTIPAGQAIFIPVYNWIFGAGVFDCEPTAPGVECDVEVLRAGAKENTELGLPENGGMIEVFIDGDPVEDVRNYRARSPGTFAIDVPEDNLLGVPEGTYDPQVADGFWLFLPPFSVGDHAIEFSVFAPNVPNFGDISFTVIWHLTIEPGS